ncbi:PKD domain-containing protein [Halomicroarcula sp. GCM10025324]|uniref:PKD domain-containing protein n=1 Tax=Haloarcula TaxID=2237 RepID=UPI0023E80733|nr:PKD domain-containing protein [Halomicroarcula sp. ZS-22-S1]
MPRSLAIGTVLALCVLGLLAGTAAATSNAPPLADAGLDQTVGADATVHLDASGSRDPDGSVARFSWTVETPTGTATRPDCPTCRQTRFQPTTTGRYAVTLTVTDDDGATSSDTLFVDVEAGAGPSVTLSGPSTVVWNRSATVTADVAAGEPSLSSVAWIVDGAVAQRDVLAGSSTTATLSRPYTTNGSVSVRAVVYDAAGHRATATHDLTVLTRTGGSGAGGSEADDCHFWSNNCLNDAVLTNAETGQQTVINANGEQGIQVMTDARGLVDANEYVDVSKYRTSTGENGPTRFEADMIDVVDNKATLDKTEQQENEQDGSPGDDDHSDDHSMSEGDSSGGSDDSTASEDESSGYVDTGAQDGYNIDAGNAGSPSTSSFDSSDDSTDSDESDDSWTSGGVSYGGYWTG